jgi:hypothetical protein
MGRGDAIFGLLLLSGFRKIEGCPNVSSNRKQKKKQKCFYTYVDRVAQRRRCIEDMIHGTIPRFLYHGTLSVRLSPMELTARFNGIVNSPSGAETRT